MSARLAARLIFVGVAIGVAALALHPDPPSGWIEGFVRANWPATRPLVIWRDTLSHIAAFLVLSLIGAAAWGVRWRLALGLATAAAALEAAQAFFPPREPSWGDLCAGLVGAAAGLGMAAVGSARWVRRARYHLITHRGAEAACKR